MAISIDDLLRRAVESKASDLHLKVGNHPYLRVDGLLTPLTDRKSTRLNSSHSQISYAVFCLKKKKTTPYSACSTLPCAFFTPVDAAVTVITTLIPRAKPREMTTACRARRRILRRK